MTFYDIFCQVLEHSSNSKFNYMKFVKVYNILQREVVRIVQLEGVGHKSMEGYNRWGEPMSAIYNETMFGIS